MSYLVGLAFTQKEGWRALECLLAPETLIRSAITVANGVLWLKSSKPARPGRFVNPATLVDFDKNSSTKGKQSSAVALSNPAVNGEVFRRNF